MHISKAALPPHKPFVSSDDKQHPDYPMYLIYCDACSTSLIERESFRDWVRSRKLRIKTGQWREHPQYREFLKWMQETSAGARTQLTFPENFQAWLTGERW